MNWRVVRKYLRNHYDYMISGTLSLTVLVGFSISPFPNTRDSARRPATLSPLTKPMLLAELTCSGRC
jgi:hypothetical protein